MCKLFAVQMDKVNFGGCYPIKNRVEVCLSAGKSRNNMTSKVNYYPAIGRVVKRMDVMECVGKNKEQISAFHFFRRSFRIEAGIPFQHQKNFISIMIVKGHGIIDRNGGIFILAINISA